MKISAVIPVYNEEGSVAKLHEEIVKALSELNVPYEIIFVDDGSDDGTFQKLQELQPIKIVRFRTNFGQTAALDAGIKAARGEYVVTMDGDGQNDPSDIAKLLEKAEKEDFDVVSGWRKSRKDPFMKKISSRLAAAFRRFLINDGIHDSGCTLKVYRRECFEDVDLYGEIHRFIPAVLKIKGFTVSELPVNHRPRTTGRTKYNWRRGVKGILDMFSVWFWKKYAARPLHLFGGAGFLFISIGSAIVVVMFVLRLLELVALSRSIWPLAGFFMIMVGIQLFIFGLLADVTIKNYYHIHKTRPYKIKEIVER